MNNINSPSRRAPAQNICLSKSPICRSVVVRKCAVHALTIQYVTVALSHSCLLSCLGSLGWLGLGPLPACLPACLPVCVHVLFLHNHNHHHLHNHYFSVAPSSEGYEKSRSLNNIAGMAGNALRLSPVTSPYGSPCPLRRSRSPIPSIL